MKDVRRDSGVNLVRSLGVVNPVAEIFDSSREKFQIFRKNLRFPDKNSDDLFFFFCRQLKNCLFSQNIHIFTFYTYNRTFYILS